MARVGAQRAAVLTGMSKSTIQRSMNNGKISFTLNENNRRVIDISELERVFGIQKQMPAQKIEQTDTQNVSDLIEKERMKMQIKMLEDQLSVANERIDDLKEQRDKWEKQASQVLITSQYSQKQAEELRTQIKERDERVRQRRLQNAQIQKARMKDNKLSKPLPPQARTLNEKMKKLRAENENISRHSNSVFRFWKKAKG